MNHEITPFFDPGIPTPILDPRLNFIESYEFGFPEKIRDWWRRVGGNKCQTHIYEERTGWRICGSNHYIQVDHIDPESVQLVEGHDPNNSIGIPRCKEHHVGKGLVRDADGTMRYASYGEPQWSRHPDMGKALDQYRQGDKDAFKKAAMHHRELAEQGKRIANSSPEVDQYEKDYMLSLEQKYMQETGERRPKVKPHQKIERGRKQ